MGTLISTGFGSDEFFRKMKHLWIADRDEAAKLLKEQVEQICRIIIWKYGKHFKNVTKEDFQDYASEAWIRMWQNMDRFLSEPRNDPDSDGPHYTPNEKVKLAIKLILINMLQVRDRKMGKKPTVVKGKYIYVDSLDRPIKSNEKNSVTVGEHTSSRDPGPEQQAVLSDFARYALQELLSLPNDSETLAAVAYVILNETFGEKQSMEDYANQLNQSPMLQIIAKMETMLADNDMNPGWMLLFRQRIEKEGGDRTVNGLTAAKLANRKNDIQDRIRKKLNFTRVKDRNKEGTKGD